MKRRSGTPEKLSRSEPGRRRWLVGAAALVLAPHAALGGANAAALQTPASDGLATAWDDAAGRHWLGLLEVGGESARVRCAVELPTRCHGLASAPDGSVFAVARRPGDWLLRWRPDPGAVAGERQSVRWLWVPPDRRFNGHVLLAPGGDTLYTTETELESDRGVLVRRDAGTLIETATWPTGGADPHDMEWLDGGHLLVANGGIRTRPETGRAKQDLAHMDSSLVGIDTRSGALAGAWRLADGRLGLRHLARHASGRIGVALQAEHDTPAERARAPLLAVFDPLRGELAAVAPDRDSVGYAGDISALGAGWAVSCPRDHDLLRAGAADSATLHQRLASVCALAAAPDGAVLWALGGSALREPAGHVGPAAVCSLPEGLRFDNHAVVWTGDALLSRHPGGCLV